LYWRGGLSASRGFGGDPMSEDELVSTAARGRRRASTGDRRTRELRILYAISEALNSAPDARHALERTLALVAELLGLHTGWIWLLDPESGRFYNAAAHNLPPYLQEPVHMTGKSCSCIGDFQDGTLAPRNISLIECSRLQPAVEAGAFEATRGLRYHASIPLYFRDKPLGIMNIAGPSWRKLSRSELRLLSTIANQIGVAIERARLAEESARLARAEERARIAREIHDTLAQGLTAIGLHIESALNHLESEPERARERLQRALAMTRQSLEEARRSVTNLRAGLPFGKPLAEALGTLARAFTAETGVRVAVQASGGQPLPVSVEAELYRIAQEALTNVRRHAQASEVRIALRTGPGQQVVLSIRDNGRGFDPASIPAGCHGLLGMRERARLLRGRLLIASRAGRGTTVTAIVPLRSEGEP
jgi:two-component system NarL family sensor kinase